MHKSQDNEGKLSVFKLKIHIKWPRSFLTEVFFSKHISLLGHTYIPSTYIRLLKHFFFGFPAGNTIHRNLGTRVKNNRENRGSKSGRLDPEVCCCLGPP